MLLEVERKLKDINKIGKELLICLSSIKNYEREGEIKESIKGTAYFKLVTGPSVIYKVKSLIEGSKREILYVTSAKFMHVEETVFEPFLNKFSNSPKVRMITEPR
ncbi:MAG: hypothetical protein QXX95_00835 [Nitrososphaerales archaeon]